MESKRYHGIFSAAYLPVPLAYGAAGNFADWNPIKGTFNFVGLAIDLLADTLFWQSVATTMMFTVVCTFIATALGLYWAMVIFRIKKLQSLFKSFTYMSYLTAIMPIAVVWRWIFLAQGSLLNNVIALFGAQGLDWLNSASIVMPSLGGLSEEILPSLYERQRWMARARRRSSVILRYLCSRAPRHLSWSPTSDVQVYDQVGDGTHQRRTEGRLLKLGRIDEAKKRFDQYRSLITQ